MTICSLDSSELDEVAEILQESDAAADVNYFRREPDKSTRDDEGKATGSAMEIRYQEPTSTRDSGGKKSEAHTAERCSRLTRGAPIWAQLECTLAIGVDEKAPNSSSST